MSEPSPPLDEIGAIYGRFLAARSENPAGLHLAGTIAHRGGRLDEAVEAYGRALALNPGLAAVHVDLGNALRELGRLGEAEASYRRALEIDPGFTNAHANLGNVLYDLGHLEEAEASYLRALGLAPDVASLHSALGDVLREQGRVEEAEERHRRALSLDPGFAPAHAGLGNDLCERGLLDEALASLSRALEIAPDDASALGNLGKVYNAIGMLAEAEASYRRSLSLRPGDAWTHSNLLLTMMVMPRFGGAEIFEQAARFGERFEDGGRRLSFGNDPDPERRLRVGYLSPSLTDHVLTNDLEPVLRGHRRDRVSVHVYAHVQRPTATTWRLKEACDAWTFVHGLSDAEVAARIEADGIDILVDPMGHWAGNRLAVFARKPAPVQVSYLCQGLTSGLSAMDYAIGDRWLNEGGAMQAFARERVIELDGGFEVTRVDHDTPIGAPPSAAAGFVTFGSFNNPTKISDATLRLWGKVLERCPAARLLIKGRLMDRPESRAHLLRRLEEHGIAAGRVDLYGFVAASDHMAWHNRVDIVLDTLPFCGGRTTVEALWMGVPVVTRIGETLVGRYGYSHLSRIGAPELAARDDAAFVETAVSLAGDPERLRHYRQTLRGLMRASPLLDAERHVAELEDAYRLMWRAWCGGATRR
ncbi:MAG: tetratricopeptide repeat protein [Alphaproteobacteria bacterium]|nr:tetratricopeptide repeat protein [Alphaproteobacteria bacterium]